ncbi:hypothetical protein GCM10010193_31460 [Kitasatospora atroaurantiaca]|uniref:DUF4304 domain-containing protein n=1 Tax=Kitasatospora atroaurantiaca TaxID=285545 RepID=A0A561ER97_9ACTN|nr:hypothetical protein [Kitasatospora atroaurantiaca]TWE18132.1 hypothetical protein FB465_3181 [Kitasatospora atroaurantiaca]
MTTAQQLFAEGIREHFAPALRALGFTGWRHSFSLPDEDHWALLGVELAGVDDRAVRYTVNLSLTPKDAWTGRALRPNPNAPTGLEVWHARIGELLPVGGEVWWEVAPGPRWLVAVEDSVAAVRHYGLPELVRRLAAAEGAETYLSPAELEDVNAALLTGAVARIQRAELADRTLVLTGAWSRSDPVAREVLAGAAEGFLSADDERFRRVRCLDTLGRALWTFPAA